MNSDYNPRLDYIDADIATQALRGAEVHIAKLLDLITAERSTLLQTRYSSLASDYESVAWFSYALGFPLNQVRDAFSNAANAHLKVFELRGTEPVFPSYSFQYNPDFLPGATKSKTKFELLHENQVADYSLTNSHKGFIAVCEALISRQDKTANKLAALIWDPPDASYIGEHSYCTRNDQRLAYALRYVILGPESSAKMELDQLRISVVETHTGHQATMVRAIATKDAGLFLDGLTGYLSWHRRTALLKQNRWNPEYFICNSGLGLCRLAINRQICVPSDFPQNDIFLPLELIT